jgi:hypothetical protein
MKVQTSQKGNMLECTFGRSETRGKFSGNLDSENSQQENTPRLERKSAETAGKEEMVRL